MYRAWARLLPLALSISGCGTAVPDIQDVPFNTSPNAGNLLVAAIVKSIHCELEDAVTRVINAGIDSSVVNNVDYSSFLQKWGVEVALTLQMDERTTLNPNGVYSPPAPAIFSLAGGVAGSAHATRAMTYNYYYKVSDLYLGRNKLCVRDQRPPPGSLLVRSNLKLDESLAGFTTGVATGDIISVANKNVMNYQITFIITTNADITPTWTLVGGSINSSGSLFSTSRDRKHDLIVTFGPLDESNSGSFLTPIAEQIHTNSQLTTYLSNNVFIR